MHVCHARVLCVHAGERVWMQQAWQKLSLDNPYISFYH